MKLLIVGATGLLGSKVGAALRPTYDVIEAALDKVPEQVDITRSDSLRACFSALVSLMRLCVPRAWCALCRGRRRATTTGNTACARS